MVPAPFIASLTPHVKGIVVASTTVLGLGAIKIFGMDVDSIWEKFQWLMLFVLFPLGKWFIDWFRGKDKRELDAKRVLADRVDEVTNEKINLQQKYHIAVSRQQELERENARLQGMLTACTSCKNINTGL